MKLSEIKELLPGLQTVDFKLPSGDYVPEHFHVTEIGQLTRHSIDCGGNERIEKVISFQLWDANDFEHRLKPEKLSKIIDLSEKALKLEDLSVEVEYQSDTISKYALEFNGKEFELVPMKTACRASDNCGTNNKDISLIKDKTEACCAPSSSCC